MSRTTQAVGAAAVGAMATLAAQWLLNRHQRARSASMNPMAPSKLAVQATSPTSGLKGQVVVVTGAAQGLGLAVAQAAAYAGAATVVLVDRDVTKGRAAAAKLSSNPALTARPFEAIFLAQLDNSLHACSKDSEVE